jgi:hypothetical protein
VGSSPPLSTAIMSRAWRLVSRASCTVVRLERADQGSVKFGRGWRVAAPANVRSSRSSRGDSNFKLSARHERIPAFWLRGLSEGRPFARGARGRAPFKDAG